MGAESGGPSPTLEFYGNPTGAECQVGVGGPGVPARRDERDACSPPQSSRSWRRSRASSFSLMGRPPPYPVSLPLLPITRWQGMMIGIGLDPLASPTAREA